ncbi:MAG TPA: MarR family transcriptional regulator [Acidimicrobiales bacterium]|nr:MarR family transcriptional regulator [Acidimicrobiales bacterium]
MTQAAPAALRMRPDSWTRAGESGLMARLVALQLVAGQQLESVTAERGLAVGDYLVLAVVRRSPGGVCAPSTVCEVLRRASGGMTLTLDRLQAAGWLTREPDPSDRRRVLLRLTPTGQELAVSVNEALHEWERSVTGRRQLRPIVDAIDELLELLEAGVGAT